MTLSKPAPALFCDGVCDRQLEWTALLRWQYINWRLGASDQPVRRASSSHCLFQKKISRSKFRLPHLEPVQAVPIPKLYSSSVGARNSARVIRGDDTRIFLELVESFTRKESRATKACRWKMHYKKACEKILVACVKNISFRFHCIPLFLICLLILLW